LRSAAPVALVLFALAAVAAGASRTALAQDDSVEPPDDEVHGKAPVREISLSDLTPEQRDVTLDAWAHVYCACPDENWSRTLANCPDGCARGQKQEIIALVRQGYDVKRIVAEQVKKYTERANADPGTAWNGSLLVVVGVLAAAGAAGFVLARWQRASDVRRAEGSEKWQDPVAAAEAAAVERELQEID
jgi:cytochrome c-type biogenesis protein CcmH/NrfF